MAKMKSARRPRQPSLPGLSASSDTRHGGDLRVGKRKTARPVDVKRSMHLTFKASSARGERSLLHPKRAKLVLAVVLRAGAKSGVRVERYVNVGNHLHLLVRPRTRVGFQRFLRTVSGRVAVIATGAVKGRPAQRARFAGRRERAARGAVSVGVRAFWDHLAFSRAVSWGRDLRGLMEYLDKNRLESLNACFAEWGQFVESAAWRYGETGPPLPE